MPKIRRSICTLEPRGASTTVSSGIPLIRHSSPSSGSQYTRSNANNAASRVAGRCSPLAAQANGSHLMWAKPHFTFITPIGFDTQRLARILDSLVRVTRRVISTPFKMLPRTTLRHAKTDTPPAPPVVAHSQRRARAHPRTGLKSAVPLWSASRSARAAITCRAEARHHLRHMPAQCTNQRT